jgi:hypothetical protein
MAVLLPVNRFVRKAFTRYLGTMNSVLARVADGSGAVLIPNGAQT